MGYVVNGDHAYRLLCDLLAGRAGPADWEALTPAGWEALLQTALSEGVAPLTYWHFNQHGWPASMPEAVRAALAGAYYDTAAFNAVLYAELARILEALEAAGVPVVVLKGAALAVTLYPDPGRRPMGDLDLLVPGPRVAHAVRALRHLGYSQEKVTYHAVMRGGSESRVQVEVHWSLVPGTVDGRRPSAAWFWEQSREWRSGSWLWSHERPLPGLSPTAQLLYLAGHLALQTGIARARLIWFYDLHLLMKKAGHDIDWDKLRARAEAFGWMAALRAALDAVRDRFEKVPRPGVPVSAAALEPRPAQSYIRDALGELGWAARLRLGWGLFLPSPGYMQRRYRPRPGWLWPFFYPYRWYDMLRELAAPLAGQ